MAFTQTYDINAVLSRIGDNVEIDLVYTNVISILSASLQIIENTPSTYETFYKYSFDGINYTDYKHINFLHSPNDIESIQIPSGKLYISLKVVLVNGKITVNNFLTEFEGETLSLVCPISITSSDGLGCTDPVSLYSSCTPCEPYNLHFPGSITNIFNSLNKMVTGMFGHTVTYFKVQPEENSSDIIFKEYALYNVIAKAQIPIVIPDNKLPEEDMLSFMAHDINLPELFEIHILVDSFCSAFGDLKHKFNFDRPEERDYLYLPLTNKMYEVESVYKQSKLPNEKTYWRVLLSKFKDRGDTAHLTVDTETEKNNIAFLINQHIADQMEESSEHSAPQQSYNGYRQLDPYKKVSELLNVVKEDILNHSTKIAKTHYNFSSMPASTPAVVYGTYSIDNSLQVSSWVRLKDTSTTYSIFTDENNIFSIIHHPTGIAFHTNNTTFEIGLNTSVYKDKWISFIFRMNKDLGFISGTIYAINQLVKNTTLETLSTIHLPFNQEISVISPIIVSGPYDITSIRLFKKITPSEDDSKLLNKYVIKEGKGVLVVDNVPQLPFAEYYQKF